MRPDKIYTPDAADIHDTKLYVMTVKDSTYIHNIVTCKNGRRVRKEWQDLVNNLRNGKTAILYESIYKIDLLKLNKAVIKQLCYDNFCSTPDKIIETMSYFADANSRCKDDESWSMPIFTLDENKIIEIQTKIIKYINCNDFKIHQIPDGYQIIFKNEDHSYEIMKILKQYQETRNREVMLPIAWQTKK